MSYSSKFLKDKKYEDVFMKIIINIIEKEADEEICFNIHELTPEISESTQYLSDFLQRKNYIIGRLEDEYHKIQTKSILYIESIDKRQYVYTKKQVFEIKERLYQLESILPSSQFIRISKSMIINLDAIASFIPKFSGNLDTKLINGEQVSISRRYVNNLKQALGMRDSNDD